MCKVASFSSFSPGRKFAEVAPVQQSDFREEDGTGKCNGIQLLQLQLDLKFVAFLLEHKGHLGSISKR